MRRFRPVSSSDELSLVGHLDELRFRILITLAALVVAFGLCFWQNRIILDLLNGPLPKGFVPLTLSPSEPFMTTVTVSLYAALAVTLPVVVFQLAAFAMPALTKAERRAVLPLIFVAPLLFVAGAAFGYFVVLPAATKFLLTFNAAHFEINLRARDYYSFAATGILVAGALFQLPVVIAALARLGLVSPQLLRRKRRPAYVVIAVVAAILPGTDPLTMVIEMVPLVLLYEVGIFVATLVTPSAAAATLADERGV